MIRQSIVNHFKALSRVSLRDSRLIDRSTEMVIRNSVSGSMTQQQITSAHRTDLASSYATEDNGVGWDLFADHAIIN